MPLQEGDHVRAEPCAGFACCSSPRPRQGGQRAEVRPAIQMIVFGGGHGPRFVGGGRGCLIMLLVSVALSLMLTIIANLLLRLL